MKNEQKKTNVAITEPGANVAPAAVILDGIPANVEKDVTTEQGAHMETLVSAPVKTAKEQADERKTLARKVARSCFIEKFNGHAAELLAARTVEENKGGKQRVTDFTFSWTDENGDAVTASGNIPVTAVLSSDAAAMFRMKAETVQNLVVPFHVADDTEKAKIRAAAEKDINSMFSLCRVPRSAKKSEIADILESAYVTNANGDYDAEKAAAIIASVSAIARRIIKGRENANNADKARKDIAEKAKAAKEVKAA